MQARLYSKKDYIRLQKLPCNRLNTSRLSIQNSKPKELNEKRPVFLHFGNLKDFGHSAVVDAYCYKEGQFMVHTNQGQGGPTDGWYDFYKGILRPDDNELRVVYTFQPR